MTHYAPTSSFKKKTTVFQDHFFLSLLKACDGYISFINKKEIYTKEIPIC